MNLAQYNVNGLELFINIETGEVFSSTKGLARMVEVEPKTIRYWKRGKQVVTIEAQIQTTTGFRKGELFDENAILEAIVKYKPEMILKFAAVGLRSFFHELVGYRHQRQEQELSYAEKISILDQREAEQQSKLNEALRVTQIAPMEIDVLRQEKSLLAAKENLAIAKKLYQANSPEPTKRPAQKAHEQLSLPFEKSKPSRAKDSPYVRVMADVMSYLREYGSITIREMCRQFRRKINGSLMDAGMAQAIFDEMVRLDLGHTTREGKTVTFYLAR